MSSMESLRRTLVSEAIPRHCQQLHADDGHGYRKQIPAPNLVHVKPISKKTNGRYAADNPRNAGGFEPVIQEALVDDLTQNGNAHFSSIVKTCSKGQPKARASNMP